MNPQHTEDYKQTAVKYYLEHNNTKNQFIQNYNTHLDLQFTKNASGGRNRPVQHTKEDESSMLFEEYEKYFTEPRTVCFNV